MNKVRLVIDNMEVEAESGKSLLDVARNLGIWIPTLCSRPDLGLSPPLGNCRLCVVEVEGGDTRFPSSCKTFVKEGMVVRTQTPILAQIRRYHFIALLSPLPSPRIKSRALIELAQTLEVKEEDIPPYVGEESFVDARQPLINREPGRCILCGLCVKVCKEKREVGAIDFIFHEGTFSVGPYPKDSLDENGCRFCGACIEICPTGAISFRVNNIPGDDVGIASCTYVCPAGIDVPLYIRLIRERRFAEAAMVIREKVPFPGVLGRVCAHPCETKCLRGQLNEPISIAALKRLVAERDPELWKTPLKLAPTRGKCIAIVGSGPAGLTAGYYLARLGYSVTIYEAYPEAGGMMQVGIPEYRLPKTIVLPEIERIKRAGVIVKTNTRVESISDLFKEGYEVVLLAIGTHKPLKLDVPGYEGKGIIEAIVLLREVNLRKKVELSGKVGVIGGGSVAIDAARTSFRLGAREVHLICLESRELMPAYEEEVEQAIEEGVVLNNSWGVKRIITASGKVAGVECIRCLSVFDQTGAFHPTFDETQTKSFEFNHVIVAIGQIPDLSMFKEIGKINVTSKGTIKVDDNLATSMNGVFATGDAVTGPSSIVESIMMGKKAASAIDRYLGGEGILPEELAGVEETKIALGPWPGFARLSRVKMPCIPIEMRKGFIEVEKGLSETMAIEEANRCLQCQLRFQIRWPGIPSVQEQ